MGRGQFVVLPLVIGCSGHPDGIQGRIDQDFRWVPTVCGRCKLEAVFTEHPEGSCEVSDGESSPLRSEDLACDQVDMTEVEIREPGTQLIGVDGEAAIPPRDQHTGKDIDDEEKSLGALGSGVGGDEFSAPNLLLEVLMVANDLGHEGCVLLAQPIRLSRPIDHAAGEVVLGELATDDLMVRRDLRIGPSQELENVVHGSGHFGEEVCLLG